MPSLQRVIDLSVVRLDEACPVDVVAQQMLDLLAWGAPGEPAVRSFLRVATGSIPGDLTMLLLRTEEAITRLANLGLVTDQGSLRLHPLLARLVREQRGPGILTSALGPLSTALAAENAAGRVVNARPWLAHLQSLARHALDTAHSQAGVLCREIGHQFWMLGAPAQAQSWLEESFRVMSQAQDRAGQDSVLNLLSLAYGLGGQYERAVQLSHQRLTQLAAYEPDMRHSVEQPRLHINAPRSLL